MSRMYLSSDPLQNRCSTWHCILESLIDRHRLSTHLCLKLDLIEIVAQHANYHELMEKDNHSGGCCMWIAYKFKVQQIRLLLGAMSLCWRFPHHHHHSDDPQLDINLVMSVSKAQMTQNCIIHMALSISGLQYVQSIVTISIFSRGFTRACCSCVQIEPHDFAPALHDQNPRLTARFLRARIRLFILAFLCWIVGLLFC